MKILSKNNDYEDFE